MSLASLKGGVLRGTLHGSGGQSHTSHLATLHSGSGYRCMGGSSGTSGTSQGLGRVEFRGDQAEVDKGHRARN